MQNVFPLHPVSFGSVRTENNLYMAPLAGYTNYPFRKMVRSFGAGLAFSEMVSAKGLHYGSEGSEALLLTGDGEDIKAAQLFGHEPEILKEACEDPRLAPFDVIDLNMGCPMPKITGNNEGSALLNDPVLAEKIVKACKASGKTITVKMRIGYTADKIVGADFAKALEQGGADLITVHGRTKDKIYAGEVNYDAIYAAKKAVKIPVIANGGVFSVEDGARLIDRTGADGVMIARAAMYDPQIFCDFTGKARISKKDMILSELHDMAGLFDERFITVYMRKMAVFYLKGERGVAKWREKLFSCNTPSAIEEMVEEIFSYSPNTD